MGIKHSLLPFPLVASVPLPAPSGSTDYVLEFYWNISKAPESIRYSLLYQTLPVMEGSLSQSDILSQISEYIYSPFANSSTLFIVRHKSSQVVGFGTFYIWEEFLLSNDFSTQNKYVLSTGFYLLSPLARGKGLLKDLVLVPMALKHSRYGLNNCIHFDVSVHPLSYLVFCRMAPIFPCVNKKMSPKIKEFLAKMIDKCGYEIIDHQKPFVVKDDTKVDGLNRAEVLAKYSAAPDELRFFIDQTRLEEGVGLAFLSMGVMIKGNTMELDEVKCSEGFNRKIGVVEIDFLRAKI